MRHLFAAALGYNLEANFMSSKPFFVLQYSIPLLDPKLVQGCSSGALMADGLANNMTNIIDSFKMVQNGCKNEQNLWTK